VLRFAWAQLRGRPRRTLALLAGVLAATIGFVVLSGSVAVQQLRVNGAIDANYRAAYDILVRPKGSRTALEDGRGLVRPNYLSGLYGGISMDALEKIRGIRHVELAAPVAMLGYTTTWLEQTVDLTDLVDRTAPRQLFRLTPKWIADRGLTVLDDAPVYVYVTQNELVIEEVVLKHEKHLTDGLVGCITARETEPDGRSRQVCAMGVDSDEDGTTPLERTRLTVVRMHPAGQFTEFWPKFDGTPPGPDNRLIVTVPWRVSVLIAAVDPVAEANLVGLDKAVVSGRYLTAGEGSAVQSYPPDQDGKVWPYHAVPALLANIPYLDEAAEVSVERLGAQAAADISGKPWEDWVTRLAATTGTTAGPPTEWTGPPRLDTGSRAAVGLVYQAGPTSYRVDAAGVLHPEAVQRSRELWRIGGGSWTDKPPILAVDNGFRPMTREGGTTYGPAPEVQAVGLFDPGRLHGFSPLTRVPLETYQAPDAVGADAASRELLGGQSLRPNSNPAGYLTTPPMLLTNLTALKYFPDNVALRSDPLSAVRVRVAGVTGVDPRNQELVRSVAEDIATATGLDVDITMGSSPTPQTVVLPAGSGGRPELRLSEGWSRKGVAVAIVQAADRKGLLLSGLILVVCTLFLGNAVAAAVRDRRRELAVLACTGWPARRLAGAVVTEVAMVGLAAGVLAAGLAVPLSRFAGVPVSTGHALLALPVGLGVALLAAAPPAVSAARARPGAALHPAVLEVRRIRRRDTVRRMALANLWRVPGRTALGVLALAVGVAALTLLLGIAVGFHNDVIGSLLGDEIAVRVRTVDVLAATVAVALGVLMVGDVLYLNVRERAAELAALWASGWSNRALVRLVGYEGLGIGVLGAVLGAGVGLLGVTWFAWRINAGIVWLAAAVAAGAVLLAGLAAVVPALLLRRLPLSTLLAEE
jgi:putative ABC transport system permease protein